MIESQNGGCGICGTLLDMDGFHTRREDTLSRFCVDRAEDGTVRGFVCRACQTGLRGFGRDVERLQRAMEYLERVSGDGEGEGGRS